MICPWLLVSLLARKLHCDKGNWSLLEAEWMRGSFSCMFSVSTGVYAFGFLFMLPQLFVNYKVRPGVSAKVILLCSLCCLWLAVVSSLFQMKSVAHLPWKAFTYKVSTRSMPRMPGRPFVGCMHMSSQTHSTFGSFHFEKTKTSFQIVKPPTTGWRFS